ncbi:glycosyltransferase family 4 protein [Pseudothauera rhizosphaerae]|uniref:Glycosyltransferase family 1 protein n=1 Tax=Pseudothauera rhizosphaerae TaxID=2565932 RepID=A0A4S4AR16_9RHOO|nr:glycosyltransferase family 1 protein [Pseudothauera rhizosphaerae]THF61747.1 glycosyltransferase family 1 protein [Pseudothauera rhizosphaerae]
MRAMDTPLVLQHLATAARQLRVAVVTETYPPEVNGVAMTTGRVVEGMLRLGHQVQLVRPRQGDGDQPASAAGFEEVLSRGLPIPRYNHLKVGLPARSALQRLWALRRPDVVQVVTEGPLGWSAVAAARKLRLPVVTEFHTNFHNYSGYYGMGWLKQPVEAWLRRFHNKGEVCLAPTAELAAQLMARGVHRVEVVARGVDTGLFSPARRSETLRRSWSAQPDTLVVAVVGRMAPEKNLALAVRAFDALKGEAADARLLFVGDGPARAALQAAHPEFVYAGMRSGEDLAAHYASADLFLFPSLTETFGNVTTEALASGLPVVAFDYAAAAERIREGYNGWLAPCGDEVAFAAAACRLAGDAALRERLRANARASVADADWEAVTHRLLAVMEEVVRTHEERGAGGRDVVTA